MKKTFDQKCAILQKAGWGFLSGMYYGGAAIAIYSKQERKIEVVQSKDTAIVYLSACKGW